MEKREKREKRTRTDSREIYKVLCVTLAGASAVAAANNFDGARKLLNMLDDAPASIEVTSVKEDPTFRNPSLSGSMAEYLHHRGEAREIREMKNAYTAGVFLHLLAILAAAGINCYATGRFTSLAAR